MRGQYGCCLCHGCVQIISFDICSKARHVWNCEPIAITGSFWSKYECKVVHSFLRSFGKHWQPHRQPAAFSIDLSNPFFISLRGCGTVTISATPSFLKVLCEPFWLTSNQPSPSS